MGGYWWGVRGSVLGLLLGGIVGCAQPVWTKPGYTEAAWRADRYACERDARQSGYYGGGIAGAIEMRGFFDRCLESKGYYRMR